MSTCIGQERAQDLKSKAGECGIDTDEDPHGLPDPDTVGFLSQVFKKNLIKSNFCWYSELSSL